MQIYTPPSQLVQAASSISQGVRVSNRDLPKLPALMQNALGSPAAGVKLERSRASRESRLGLAGYRV